MILIIGGAYQGKEKFALEVLKIDKDKIFSDFNFAVKNEGEAVIDKIFAGGYDAVISDEIGCGIIPLDKADRELREKTGRIQCALAARCSEVWRVSCGIGTKIKG